MDNQEQKEGKHVCGVCHKEVLDEYYFCPNCGNNLKEGEKPVSVIIQIGLYALAIFLPPLGLWPGVKYIMKKNKQAKIVGWVVVFLTLASSALTIWGIFVAFDTYLGQLDSLMIGL